MTTRSVELLLPFLDAVLADGDEAFVIFEDERTGKFVQFGLGGLRADLPLAALEPAERDAAASVFLRHGVGEPVLIDGGQQAFQLDFGADTARAAQFVLEVFSEIYGEDAPVLTVENQLGMTFTVTLGAR